VLKFKCTTWSFISVYYLTHPSYTIIANYKLQLYVVLVVSISVIMLPPLAQTQVTFVRPQYVPRIRK